MSAVCASTKAGANINDMSVRAFQLKNRRRLGTFIAYTCALERILDRRLLPLVDGLLEIEDQLTRNTHAKREPIAAIDVQEQQNWRTKFARQENRN
jgi:hypothetical protein